MPMDSVGLHAIFSDSLHYILAINRFRETVAMLK